MRAEGLNNRVIVMNVARYQRGYDGSNEPSWRGYAFSGPELIEICHGGVEVAIRSIESYFDQDGYRTLAKTSKSAPPVIEVGHIPWNWIEDIVPEGDEFDGSAIFFVRHRAPGWHPYDFLTYRDHKQERFGPNSRAFYPRLPELGTRRPKFVRDWWRFRKSLLVAARGSMPPS